VIDIIAISLNCAVKTDDDINFNGQYFGACFLMTLLLLKLVAWGVV